MARSWLATIFCVTCLGLITQVNIAKAGLEDILYEKGQLTKEEWLKVKAEKERASNEQDKLEDQLLLIQTNPHGRKGLLFSSDDGNFEMQIGVRVQLRYSSPQDSDSLTAGSQSNFDDKGVSSFRIRRARFYIGGYGYQPWLKYYFEYDVSSNTLLDWRVDVAKYKWAKLRVGQWKINYNRERVDSAANQQFVDRSIVNAPFTLDRQIGAMLYGDLFAGTPAYLIYNVGVFTGVGINQPHNDDKHMLYLARLQWNFLGRDLLFSQSDVEYTENPTGSLAFAAAHNQADRFNFPTTTREAGVVDGQFEINQAMEEIAFKYRGFSFQQEFHVKEVYNQANKVKTKSLGAYAQAGYFPHALIDIIPAPLEVAFRSAFVDPDDTANNDVQREQTVAVNWFFSGHSNKLTLDYSHLTQDAGIVTTVDRVRLQWDISF
jgi:phosphate-selective porin OprO and OprP